MSNLTLAFIVSLCAGLATGIGSLIAFIFPRTNKKFLTFGLGFSAGVMIYISFWDIVAKARDIINPFFGDNLTEIAVVCAFFGGVAVIFLIDFLIPDMENPHEFLVVESHLSKEDEEKIKKLYRAGLVIAAAIGIHNFPEGLVTFFATLNDPSVGIAVGIAIAIHNIPEGIAVSMPIYHATGSRKKAFWYSFFSGVAEPLGAVLGYTILAPFMSPLLMGIVFSGVAGIMVYVSVDELLPGAEAYGHHHYSMIGFILGMLIMALSLLLFMI